MKKLQLLLITLGLLTQVNAQEPTLEWANAMGGTWGDYGGSITTDASGNVYTTGGFSGTVDFDPGTGTTNLTSLGSYDIFIQKLDADGNLLWVKQMGGTSNDQGLSITTDAVGNVYAMGYFSGTVDFDPSTGTTNLTSAGSLDIFIQKLDASGNLLWVKKMGGAGSDFGRFITTDADGNVYTTGWFLATVDFDPGSGTTNLTSLGGYDIFIQKLDASGNLLWVKQMGGTGEDKGSSITTDAVGNVYTTGSFFGTVDFDPGTGTANLTWTGGTDIFIQKLDANGNLVWVKQMGGTLADVGYSITTDANGNIYTTGNFNGTGDFDPGIGTTNLTSAGSNDIFIQKLDTGGNLLWVKQMGGTLNDHGRFITADAVGNVYTTGSFGGTVDFDPGTGITNLTSMGSGDIFIQKLDAGGNLLWVKQMGGTSNDYGHSITTDVGGNVYSTGFFNGTADFDPGAGTTNLTSMGSSDIFVLKLSIPCTETTNTLNPTACTTYTVPSGDEIYTSTGTYMDTIPNVAGCDSVLTINLFVGDITAPVKDVFTLADLTSECSVVTPTAPTATDNCAGTITGTTITTFPITIQGTTVITWSYADGNGNSSTQTQNVVITDITNPITPTLANATGECSATAVAPTTTDNCTGTITGTTTDALTYSTQGTHPINWTFDDGNGNSIVVVQNVVISDITNPVTPTLANVTGECSATAVAPTTTDNCAGIITGTTTDALTYSTQGTHPINWTFDDGNGNSIIVVQNVVITDVTNPVNDVATLIDLTSECSVAMPTSPTATDNCAGTITGTTSTTFPITTQGTTVVTWSYDDGNGNSSTQTQNVVITPIDNTVSQTGIVLTANAGGYSYQWVDCDNGNAQINGENNQSFTPTLNGSYAVEISSVNCMETSTCTVINSVGIDALEELGIKIYPNPSNGQFTIDVNSNASIEIVNVLGEIVLKQNLKSGTNAIDISTAPSGLYFINVKTKDAGYSKRIVLSK